MSEEAPEAPGPAKVDPETLVLRGSPGRVARFRRGAIIAIAALGSTAIVGTAWIALKPAAPHLIVSDDDRQQIGAKVSADTLADAPKTYGDVPRLGPPLPGDLGKPILDRQRSLDMTPAGGPADVGSNQAAQVAQMERQRIAEQRKTARESGVIVQISGADRGGQIPASGEAVPPVAASAASVAETAKLALDPDRDPNAQQHKADFLSQRDNGGDTNPHALTPATSPWTLSAGSIIAASLITGLDSDLPGLVTAQITENVYDTVTGRKRALVAWQRIILPDGSSMRIDNVPATDTAGYAGLADKIDVHTWQLLKGVVLSSLLGVGTQLSIGGDGDLVRAIRESTQQSASRAGDQLVSRNLGIQPTIRVRPGWPLRVVVNKDIVLRPWDGKGDLPWAN
jgi:type IV secretion system protein VirB10